MALYWPEARTALFIIDDPDRDRIEDDEKCEVALLSLSPDCSLERYGDLMSTFAWLLGEDDSDEPDAERRARRLRTRTLLHLNDISKFRRQV